MTSAASLYFVILELERILPMESLTFIKDCVNTKCWGMGDTCFTCTQSFKNVIGLYLPKKVKLRELNVNGKNLNIPLCDNCETRMYNIDGFDKVWPDLRQLLLSGYDISTYAGASRVIDRIYNLDLKPSSSYWDPMTKYKWIQYRFPDLETPPLDHEQHYDYEDVFRENFFTARVNNYQIEHYQQQIIMARYVVNHYQYLWNNRTPY
jgi:hypothetical protein